tara:strand:+ start:7778 stop:8878 length:1101 start_codon:yes stop_codon:yes gene_type:complete
MSPIQGANLDGNGIPQDEIKFSQIEKEFGRQPGANNRTIGNYCISNSFGSLTDVRLDNEAGKNANTPIPGPKGQEVKFSDFYNGKLNVAVDLWSGGGTVKRAHAKTLYKNKDVKVLGPTPNADAPTWQEMEGRRVIIHVNKKIKSETENTRSICALRTGSWKSTTKVQLDIGSSGIIYGAGGKGGNGANDESDTGDGGKNGNSAIGIQHNGTVVSVMGGAYIQCGFGGGGGGGGGYRSDKGGSERCAGSGGGGGAGLPAGAKGTGGDSSKTDGNDGNKATANTRGTGGASVDEGNADGGKGGNGGGINDKGDILNPQDGDDGSNSEGGSSGNNGAAIRKSASVSWSYAAGHPLGTVHGSTSATGVT